MIETVVTSDLSNPEILNKLSKIKLLICDVDYTVSDFGAGNVSGNRKIRDVLGDRIANEMNRMFDLILRGHRDLRFLTEIEKQEYRQLMLKIEKYTLKYWCREAYLILATRKYKMDLSPAEIMEAADIYWSGVSENLQYYPDAKIFLNKVKSLAIPIIWMTGSDCRTKVGKGYENNWVIIYDSEYSKNKKIERLAELLEDFPGIMVTGDPIDKPNPKFYDAVFLNTFDVNYEDILVVGDSEINDLANARKRGCQTVLVER